ncbi:concanavalin A-like lectin/glucanase [Aureobasidium pullulans]|uniref:Concanavalin A-like lectin/glucanase n=1 Tax=Aureobasidium pullulans TaxID=5580 RepID=A0A4S9LPQ5_AURPU|nr:concanavalin A-like lectin/glucanase [Aureobasidium pullulans]
MLSFKTFLHLFLLTTIAAVIADATPSNSRPSASDSSLDARSATDVDGTFDGCHYQVEGAGAFSNHFSFDFTTMDTLPDEFIASTYEVGSGPYAPYAHIFNPDNIVLGTGQPMQMIVPGGQTADPLDTCQLVTRYDDILYASVRTVAQVSPVNGTVHGFFMYMNDTQETDIEIRTGDPGHVHFTNQQTHPGNGETTYAVAAPSTMTSAFHEYRYDWLSTGTNFYIDGVLTMTITRNNPSSPGWLMWNSWSNGYAWTYGPPLQDNILLIRSVEAYFNRSSVDTSNCEPSAATSIRATSTSAGARVTTNAAAVSSRPTSAADIETTKTDAGTSSITSTLESQTTIPAASTTNEVEVSESTTLAITNTNTSQTTITTGIAPDSTDTVSPETSSASPTPTIYADGSTPVISGVAFTVETDTLYSGTLLSLPAKRAATTVDNCLQTCAANSACVGTVFYGDSYTCSYYSSFDKNSKTTDIGSTFAAVQDREESSSGTSVSLTSTVDIGSGTDIAEFTTLSSIISSTEASEPAAASSTTILLSINTTSSTPTISSTPTPSTTLTCPLSNQTAYTDPASNKTFIVECGIDHSGGDISMIYVSDLAGCIAACAKVSNCVDVSLSGSACYLKGTLGGVVDNEGLLGARLVTESSTSSTGGVSSTSSMAASSTSTSNAAVYTRPSFQQLLQLHIDARLVVPSSL